MLTVDKPALVVMAYRLYEQGREMAECPMVDEWGRRCPCEAWRPEPPSLAEVREYGVLGWRVASLLPRGSGYIEADCLRCETCGAVFEMRHTVPYDAESQAAWLGVPVEFDNPRYGHPVFTVDLVAEEEGVAQ